MTRAIATPTDAIAARTEVQSLQTIELENQYPGEILLFPINSGREGILLQTLRPRTRIEPRWTATQSTVASLL